MEPTRLAAEREAALQREAASWAAPTDPELIPWATEAEIPVLDLGPYFASGKVDDLEAVARRLREAADATGFHYVSNHGVPSSLIEEAFDAARRFHALPAEQKSRLAMDTLPSKDSEVRAGCGYIETANRKLPAREKANMVAAFIVKREIGPRDVILDKMPWPDENVLGDAIAGFRATVERYCAAMEALALRMLPIYAVALGLRPGWFDAAFRAPLFRLRLSAYEATPRGEYGINPHVDTSFFTILAPSGPGLIVQTRTKGNRAWVRAPHKPEAFVINFGELLAQITNDSWPATRHYALNPAESAIAHGCDGGTFKHLRFSLPFFFNATPTYPMAVLPTCTDSENPPRYPPMSYLEGQGVAQGE
ncbi:hypothetical protein AB1Y20_022938 [Prymnesium parvum]|uniref:Fe2OG dioxygenase domain-containing protein n=1 Tax=Prymnesium parvum TaxID=97485 RepID=A0AB34JFM1_PRYPA